MDDVLELCKSTMEKFDAIDIGDVRIAHEYVAIDFEVHGISFTLYTLCSNVTPTMPFVTATNADNSLPHFLLRELVVGDKKIRSICLYENEHYISHLFSIEEKIEFIISQLLSLLNLSASEIEAEYQKEFLYYWNNKVESKSSYSVYLDNTCSYSLLELYRINDERVERFAIVHPNIRINQQVKKDWQAVSNKTAIFIEIKQTKGIIPPLRNSGWDVKTILDIIDNKQIQQIEYDAYKFLTNISYNHKSVVFVFKINNLIFGCELHFKNKGVAKLMDKIKLNTAKLEYLYTTRVDFQYLNQQIGNDTSLLALKVAIVGIGSLGSYVATEIVKSGVKKLTLIDEDSIDVENIMRHRSTINDAGLSKSFSLAYDLHKYHPEVNVTYLKERLRPENIDDYLKEDVDVVVFTGLGSDSLIGLNRTLHRLKFSKPILYSWLEGDGQSGHVVGIDYSKSGCFQCLFTDEHGKKVPNKLNQSSDTDKKIIRNGCGGVRVAYGNIILLQTTALILDGLNHILSADFDANFANRVAKNTFQSSTTSFYEGTCDCCNDSSQMP